MTRLGKRHVMQILFAAVMIVVAGGSQLLAVGVANNTFYTAQSIRKNTMANADAEAAFYVPAGLVFAKPGIHATFDDMMVIEDDKQKAENPNPAVGARDYNGRAHEYLIPAVSVSYVSGSWAAFMTMNVVGVGAGYAEYPDGSLSAQMFVFEAAKWLTGTTPANVSHQVDGTTIYMGLTIGGAYKLNDIFAIGAGVRYVYATNNANAHLNFDLVDSTGGRTTIDYTGKFEDDAHGVGGVLSLFAIPIKTLSIGVRCESPVKLEFKQRDVQNTGTANGTPIPAAWLAPFSKEGKKVRYDLPMVLGFGVAYKVFSDLEINFIYDYSFQKWATWQNDVQKHYENAYIAGIGVEYIINPTIRVSSVVSYSFNGSDNQNFGVISLSDNNNYESPVARKFWSANIGAGINLTADLLLNVAFAYQFAFTSISTTVGSSSTGYYEYTLSKKRLVGAVGVTNRF